MRRLLAIRLSSLGDVIHTIPAVIGLRDAFEVAWVVESPYRELVEIVAGVRAIGVSLKKWSPSRILSAFRTTRGNDVAVDFQGLIKSALVARFSGAGFRYGFDAEFIREKPAALFLNRTVRVDASKHVVDWNIELAHAVRDDHQPIDPAPDFAAFPFGDFHARGRVVLLPGAGRAEKLWPIDRFRELARSLGDKAIVVWGPGERELAESIGAEVAPPTNLRELAQILRDAAVVVGGDTGPLHLAAALRARVIGLYGPTDPKRNGPYGQIDGCISTFETSKSMETISAADVYARVQEVASSQ